MGATRYTPSSARYSNLLGLAPIGITSNLSLVDHVGRRGGRRLRRRSDAEHLLQLVDFDGLLGDPGLEAGDFLVFGDEPDAQARIVFRLEPVDDRDAVGLRLDTIGPEDLECAANAGIRRVDGPPDFGQRPPFAVVAFRFDLERLGLHYLDDWQVRDERELGPGQRG